MAQISIKIGDGSSVIFAAEKIIRIQKCTSRIGVPPHNYRTFVQAEGTNDINTDETADQILESVGDKVPMVKLTSPEGSPAWINASKVTSSLSVPEPKDIVYKPDVHFGSKFFLGKLVVQFVQETPEIAQAAIDKAKITANQH